MRSILLLGGLCMATVGGIAPAVTWGQHPHVGHNCCATCEQPRRFCKCTTFVPVVETRFRKQRFVSYRDVTKTAFRREMQVETVPVTKHDCVTVDEGCYQMVWVPKFVTKVVPRTELQQRLKCVTVPYQVNCKVPEVQTCLVPEQRVRCVRQTHLVEVPSAPCVTPPCAAPPVAPGCGVPSFPYVPPVSSLNATTPAPPAPDPHYLDTPSLDDTAEYDGPSVIIQSRKKKRTSRPSAAAVWQSRAGIVRR